MKRNFFNVSLCKNGLLGGLLYVEETELLYRTNKLTVPEKIRRLHMPYSEILQIEKAPFHTVIVSTKNDGKYRFLVFARAKFMDKVNGYANIRN